MKIGIAVSYGDVTVQKLQLHIGARLRRRRKQVGLTQADVAARLSVSHQLIQKYESGEARLAADALYAVGRVLGVPPSYFFDDFNLEQDAGDGLHRHGDLVQPGPRHSATILLVEDNPEDEALFRNAIERHPRRIAVRCARDGISALAFLRNKKGENPDGRLPDLVFLDLNIPKKNGADVLKDVRADRALSFLPVVVLTNSLRAEDIMRSYGLFASGYVCKPFDIVEFRLNLDRVLDYWLGAVVIPASV